MAFQFEPQHRDIPDAELLADIQRVAAGLGDQKLTWAAYGRAGSFGVQLKTPVNSWADVRNKKVRGGPIEGIIESIKAIGANAVPMAFN